MEHDEQIVLWHEDYPPSVNRLYFHRAGRTILTEEGRRWKNRYKAEKGHLPTTALISLTLDPQHDYIIQIYYYKPLDEIYNMGHESMGGGDRRVKHRHKPWDGPNLDKVVADAASELLGFNDRAFMSSASHKRPVPPGLRPGILVLVSRYIDRYDPFELDPDIYDDVRRRIS